MDKSPIIRLELVAKKWKKLDGLLASLLSKTGYDTTSVLVPSNDEEWLDGVLNSIAHMPQQKCPGAASTLCTTDGDYVLVADCDSFMGMIAAKKFINDVWNHKTYIVVSTPGKFWIITDIYGELDKMIHMLGQVPGIDQQYFYCARDMKKLVLRATPSMDIILPQFPPPDEMPDDPIVSNWIQMFKDHFNSEVMHKIIIAMELHRGVRNGTIGNMVQDPNFTV